MEVEKIFCCRIFVSRLIFCEFTKNQFSFLGKSYFTLVNSLNSNLAYEKFQAFYWMACIWGLRRNRWTPWNSYFYNKKKFYLYIFYHHGLSCDHISFHCFLDECKKIYFKCKTQSIKIFIEAPAHYRFCHYPISH